MCIFRLHLIYLIFSNKNTSSSIHRHQNGGPDDKRLPPPRSPSVSTVSGQRLPPNEPSPRTGALLASSQDPPKGTSTDSEIDQSSPYDGSQQDEVELANTFSDFNDEGQFVLHVVHPRWCQACVAERAGKLLTLYNEYIAGKYPLTDDGPVVTRKRALLKGIYNGRCIALSRSLREGKELRIQKEFLDVLAALDLDRGSREVEELAALFDRHVNMYCEFGDAFMLGYDEVDIMEKGEMEGRIFQAAAETRALRAGDRELAVEMLEKLVN